MKKTIKLAEITAPTAQTIDDVVLRKGDVVRLGDNNYALVFAVSVGRLQLVDLTCTLGNRWGDDFEQGATVGDRNAGLWTKINEVYGEGEFALTLGL